MFRNHLGAFALAVLCVLPLAASAQTAPAPGVGAPPQAQQQPHHRRHRSPYLRAMRGLNLNDAQKQQIAGILKKLARREQGRRPADPARQHAGHAPPDRRRPDARSADATAREGRAGAPAPRAAERSGAAGTPAVRFFRNSADSKNGGVVRLPPFFYG